MNIENIFTVDELALIDSGNYKPGRAVLDAKLDLACAMERETCALVCINIANKPSNVILGVAINCAEAIRARGQK